MMHTDERRRLEEEIHDFCKRGELSLAVEHALRGYGLEIRRLMMSILHDDQRAQDAFSLFCEHLLRGLPKFRWESAFRTWAHRMAINACLKVVNASSPREVAARSSALSNLPDRHRTSTNPWQRTDVKNRFRALREHLEPEEQRLLALRVDQQLPWEDVARALSASEEPMTAEALRRKSMVLRQHFVRIKARLRTLSQQEGLSEC